MIKFSVLCRKAYSPLDPLNKASSFWSLYCDPSETSFFLLNLVVVAFLSDLQIPCAKNK